jgi:hypothetical protein
VFWTAKPIGLADGCTDARPVQHLRQILLAVELVRLEHIGNAAIEMLDHAVGAWCSGLDQVVLDTELMARLVKHMLATGLPLAQTIRELLSH